MLSAVAKASRDYGSLMQNYLKCRMLWKKLHQKHLKFGTSD